MAARLAWAWQIKPKFDAFSKHFPGLCLRQDKCITKCMIGNSSLCEKTESPVQFPVIVASRSVTVLLLQGVGYNKLPLSFVVHGLRWRRYLSSTANPEKITLKEHLISRMKVTITCRSICITLRKSAAEVNFC